MSCPTYEAPFASQLQQGGPTGPVDCMAWSASRAIAMATCGAKVPSGRTIRLLSSEPVPNPSSPGLNLGQVAAVARDDYGVHFEVHSSTYAQVPWSQYEARRLEGQPTIIAVGYAPIADSSFDAGRGFRGNHALAENTNQTYDPLADGRAPGVWRYDGRVYPRDIIRRAAGALDIGNGTVRDGYVWCAFGRDVVPDYRAVVPAGTVLLYTVTNGSITARTAQHTGGFSAGASAPRSYPDAAGLPGSSYYLSRLLTGSRAGYYVSASKYVRED